MEEEEQQEEPAGKMGHLDHSNRKKKVGNYLLGNILGEGSFSKVRQGLHIIARERVAVKIVTKKAVLLRDVVKRSVRREAVLLQRLEHTNIVRLYEIMETENSYYLVQELAESGDFIKYLTKKKKLEEHEVQKYIGQVASALDHMHASNITHRDLKLENLLLDKDHNIKIIDFGLGNIFYGDNSLSTRCGCPVYAAPELFCHTSYGPGVDVWSMGVCMYAMLTGRLPFPPDQADNHHLLQATILQGARIPEGLTIECTDLLSGLLTIDVTNRIGIEDVVIHPFLTGNSEASLVARQHTTGKQSTVVPKASVINYMTTVFNFMEDDIIYSVIERKMNAVAATYHLLQKRFDAGLHLVGSSLGSGQLKGTSAGHRDVVLAANINGQKEPSAHVTTKQEPEIRRETESALSRSTYKSYLQLLKDSKLRSAQSIRSSNSSNISQKEMTLRRYKTRPDYSKHSKGQEEVGFLPDFVLTYADRDGQIGNRRAVGKYEWEQSFVISRKDTQKTDSSLKQPNQYEPNRAPSVFVSGKEIFVRAPVKTEFERTEFSNELFAPPSTPATPFVKDRPIPRLSSSGKYRHIVNEARERSAGGGLSDTASVTLYDDDDDDDIPWPHLHKQRNPGSNEGHVVNAKRIKDTAYQYGLNLAKSKSYVSREVKSYFREIENAQVLGQGRKLVDRNRNAISSSKFEELNSIWSRKSRTATSQRELPSIPTTTSIVRRPLSHDFISRHSSSNGALTLPEVRGKQIDELQLFDSPKQTVSGGVTDVIKVHITSSNKT